MATDLGPERPLLGIGACLAGYAVQYDGQSKTANRHVQALATLFDTRAFCPEAGIGMGVPRPPIHLVGSADAVRVLDVHTHTSDFTAPIRDYAAQVLRQAPDMVGYILVKASPSCGHGGVKRYSTSGRLLAADQDGVFAAELGRRAPLLALEDDAGLTDPGRRESFLTRAYAHHDWNQLPARGLGKQALAGYWSRYRHHVMAHDPASHHALGRLLAGNRRPPLDALADTLINIVMAALRKPATRRSHGHVLSHIAARLGRRIPPKTRQRLAVLIEDYRRGQAPLVAPIALLRHYSDDEPDAYIDGQWFPEPGPVEPGCTPPARVASRMVTGPGR